ncbi:MAG TPA: glutamate 5-kinase [Clostridia bacterium]|jgi:glutamate 5-kinase|nr:glutamate 5-kinase [Clostridia bacterium]
MTQLAFLKTARRLVIKIGSSTLTYSSGKLNLYQLERLVREIADLKNQGLEIIIVTSGAVGAGMGKMGLVKRPKNIPEKQALAAIGQGILMHMYEKFFGEYDLTVAQILLTREDFVHRERYLNARNTLLTLLNFDVIPIINENDTVAFEEIKFGDNDTLAALVAGLVDADLLILLSDIDGLYTHDPRKTKSAILIKIVEEITSEIMVAAGGAGSKLGSGGMLTKIEAAKISGNSGVPLLILNGSREGIMRQVISGFNPGTLFLPREDRLNMRKTWIAVASKIEGILYVDEGAAEALGQKGKSLLPSGIKNIEGDFERGCVVKVIGEKGEIARGIVNYSAQEIKQIKGCQSWQIETILGYKDYDEVIHRNNLTLKI